MKIRTKISLFIFLLGFLLITSFLTFIIIFQQIDNIRYERQKISELLITWDEFAIQTNLLITSNSPESSYTEWKIQYDNFQEYIQNFAVNHVRNLKIRQDSPQNRYVQDMLKIWGVIDQELFKIDTIYSLNKIKSFYEFNKPLSTVNAELNIKGNEDSNLSTIVKQVNDYDIFRKLLVNTIYDLIYQIDKTIEAKSTKYIFITLIVFVIISLSFIGLSLLFAVRLSKNIASVEGAIQKISEGDFDTKLEIDSKDEFGILAENFNEFMRILFQRNQFFNKTLQMVSQKIQDNFNLSQVYSIILENYKRIAEFDDIYIYSFDDQTKSFTLEVSSKAETNPLDMNVIRKIKLSDRHFTVIEYILESKSPLILNNDAKNFRYKDLLPQFSPNLTSLMMIPTVVANHITGMTLICNRGEKPFQQICITHSIHFTEFAGITIDNYMKFQELINKQKMEKEMEIASIIQQDLLPKNHPFLSDLELDTFYEPMGMVGGDYYDIMRVSKEVSSVIICDVSGKGFPAAMIMVIIRTIIHLIIRSVNDISKIFKYLNVGLATSVATGYYATGTMLLFNNKKKEFAYANAGHVPILYYKKETGATTYLDTNGYPLGIDKECAYESKTEKYGKGDIFVLCTDGFTESTNSEGVQYELTSITKIVEENNSKSCREIKDMIITDHNNYTDNTPKHDDQTLIIIKIK